MRSLQLGLLLVTGMGSQALSQGGDPAIVGTWRAVALQDGGRTAPPDIVEAVRWVVTQTTIVQATGSETTETTYTVDAAATPMSIDVQQGSRTMLGIFEVEGDTLRVCFSEGQHRDERPTAFVSETDSANDVLMVFQRVEP